MIVAPRPVAGIDHASASIETPFGHAAVAWQLDGGDRLTLDVELPFGTTATLRPPVTDASTVTVDGVVTGRDGDRGAGPRTR